MFFEKSTVRKARTRGKILGFFHAEQGKTVSGEALTDLAHAESFAFVYTSRLLSRFASRLRSVYENAFVEEYTAIVTTPPGFSRGPSRRVLVERHNTINSLH